MTRHSRQNRAAGLRIHLHRRLRLRPHSHRAA